MGEENGDDRCEGPEYRTRVGKSGVHSVLVQMRRKEARRSLIAIQTPGVTRLDNPAVINASSPANECKMAEELHAIR